MQFGQAFLSCCQLSSSLFVKISRPTNCPLHNLVVVQGHGFSITFLFHRNCDGCIGLFLSPLITLQTVFCGSMQRLTLTIFVFDNVLVVMRCNHVQLEYEHDTIISSIRLFVPKIVFMAAPTNSWILDSMFVTSWSSLLLVWKMVLSSPDGLVFMLYAFRQCLQPLWSFMVFSVHAGDIRVAAGEIATYHERLALAVSLGPGWVSSRLCWPLLCPQSIVFHESPFSLLSIPIWFKGTGAAFGRTEALDEGYWLMPSYFDIMIKAEEVVGFTYSMVS